MGFIPEGFKVLYQRVYRLYTRGFIGFIPQVYAKNINNNSFVTDYQRVDRDS